MIASNSTCDTATHPAGNRQASTTPIRLLPGLVEPWLPLTPKTLDTLYAILPATCPPRVRYHLYTSLRLRHYFRGYFKYYRPPHQKTIDQTRFSHKSIRFYDGNPFVIYFT